MRGAKRARRSSRTGRLGSLSAAGGWAPGRSSLRNGPSRCTPSERAPLAGQGARAIARAACAYPRSPRLTRVGQNAVTPPEGRAAATPAIASGSLPTSSPA